MTVVSLWLQQKDHGCAVFKVFSGAMICTWHCCLHFPPFRGGDDKKVQRGFLDGRHCRDKGLEARSGQVRKRGSIDFELERGERDGKPGPRCRCKTRL